MSHRGPAYRKLPFVVVTLSVLLIRASGAAGGDWPQILGPNRNGQAIGERPPNPWENAGPVQLWTASVGEGYAGPAVSGKFLVIFHRVGADERVEALHVASGDRIWHRDFPASYQGTFNPDSGPRCVPLIDDDRIFVFGASGDLHCVGLQDGQSRWSVDAYGDFNGREGYFGAGSTPILSHGKLLVNLGGRRAGLAAFDANTGRPLWQKTNEAASYASPTLATIGGREAVVFVTRLNTLAVDPRDGNELFRFDFGKTGPTVNAATPLVFGDLLFVSASYGVGAKLARMRATGAEIIWNNDTSMSSQYTTCVYHEGFLYGTHGREDFSNGEFRCVEAATGDVRWRVPETGTAHPILVGGRLLIVGIDGRLTLADASPDAFRPLAEATLSRQTTRALPAFSNGRLFVRDSANLRCFAL